MGKEATQKARLIDREDEKRRVTALFDKTDENGKPYSRARIMRETGASGRQVSKIAAEVGYTFDRSSPGLQAMKTANEEDLRHTRMRVSKQVLDELEEVFKLMRAEHVVVGWHQGMAFEHKLKRPTSSDLRNYATTIGILIDKHLVLERHLAEEGGANPTLSKMQTVTEVIRMVKTHPDMAVEDVINEVMNK